MAGQSIDWNECLQFAALSDVGMRRANNQDAHAEVLASDLETWNDRGHLFIVADGMGAHAAGELASKMAVDTVAHTYHKEKGQSPPEAVQHAMRHANAEIHERGEANAEFHKMGTTCSALLVLPQGALAAHVGDSRVYRLRGTRLQQLTFDHSLVWEMRAAGQVPKEGEGACAIPKNVITRSLGPHPTVQVDIEGPFPTEVGDVFLLCSDGLTGRVRDQEIALILEQFSPAEAVEFLVDLANIRGGPDNITVTALKIVGPRIATRSSPHEPLTVGGGQNIERTVHLSVWLTLGVSLLAALVMTISGRPMIATVGGVAALIAMLAAFVQKFGLLENQGVKLAGGRRLGRGPHRQTELPEVANVVEALLGELNQAREAIQQRSESADQNEFEHCFQTVVKVVAEHDNHEALRACRLATASLARLTRRNKGFDSTWGPPGNV